MATKKTIEPITSIRDIENMVQDSKLEFRKTLEQALSNRKDKDDIIDEVDAEVGGLLAKFAKQFFSRLAITIDEFSS